MLSGHSPYYCQGIYMLRLISVRTETEISEREVKIDLANN